MNGISSSIIVLSGALLFVGSNSFSRDRDVAIFTMLLGGALMVAGVWGWLAGLKSKE